MLEGEQILFAVYAVQLGFATPGQVSEAASGAGTQPARGLAERLVASGVLSQAQRDLVQRRVARHLGDQAATLATPSPSHRPEAAGPPHEGRPTVDLKVSPGIASADPQVDRVFEQAAPSLPGAAGAALAEESEEHISLQQSGRYTVQKVHARGGQARILLAFDEHVGRDVAIKEFYPDAEPDEGSLPSSASASSRQLSSPGQLRFLREARVTAQLEHPNIVPVHEVGRKEDGTLYYTMRFVRGQTLARKLKGCRGLRERLKLLGAFWDVAKAVAFAHARGVIHRDLKPENIMVGEFDETVLLDWGVAKVHGKKDIRAREIERELRLLQQSSPGRTAAGTAIGTPSYMSPEQARGQIDDIDERSDVWGLGAVLYELLTGRPPFKADSAMQTILLVGEAPLTPVRTLCPEAPAELAAVAEKALRRDKGARYQGARELAEEVGAYMTGGRVQAYAYSSWELLRRFAAKNRAVMLAGLALLAVILGSLVAVSVSLSSETRAREGAERAEREAVRARSEEAAGRRAASFHLAQAYAEKADRMQAERRTGPAAAFAAAALLHNPAQPGGLQHDPAFAAAHPEAQGLRVAAASILYRLGFAPGLGLERSLLAGEALSRVAFSPDGLELAAAGFDGRVWLWPAAGGAPRQLEGHLDQVHALAYAPDGRWLASGGREGRVIFWERASGKPARVLPAHRGRVTEVAFSPDSAWLASAGEDGALRLWETRGGDAPRELERLGAELEALAFSPDGARLAAGGDGGALAIWELRRGRVTARLRGHRERVMELAFSPDGRALASGGKQGELRLWDVPRGAPRAALTGHADGVLGLAFSPDGRLLASSGYDRTLRLWSIPEARHLTTCDAHPAFVLGVAFSPDGQRLATCGHDRGVRIWSVQAGRALKSFQGHDDTVYTVRHSPDGRRLATGGWDRSVRLWDAASGRLERTLTGHTQVVESAVWTPDGARLASTSRDRSVRLWDAATGRPLGALRGHEDEVHGADFSPDGALLATASTDRSVRLWDLAAGQELRVLRGHEDKVDNVVFSPDGLLLASASSDRTARLWDPRTGEQVRVLAGHADWISGVAFSPDGARLVTSGKDGLAIVWDVASGRQRIRLAGHTAWVNSARFSPDGRLLATASDDRSVRLWDALTGEPRLTLQAGSEVVAIEFSADGRELLVGDGPEVRAYPVDLSFLEADPRALLEAAERRTGLRLQGFGLAPAEGRP